MTSLLDEYRIHAADHGAHTVDGDSEATNASYNQVQSAFLSLMRQGKGHELFALYDDTDPSVQCWAAAHTLEVDEARAIRKLEQLKSAGIPHVSTNAHFTIEEWKSGNLRFLPR
jgi:hypothetical protein